MGQTSCPFCVFALDCCYEIGLPAKKEDEMKSRIFVILLLCMVFEPFGFAQQTNSSAPAAPSADQTASRKEPLQPAKVTSLELLGFQRCAKDAPVHAIAFQLKGCEDKGYDFKYCDYVREQDETLRLIF